MYIEEIKEFINKSTLKEVIYSYNNIISNILDIDVPIDRLSIIKVLIERIISNISASTQITYAHNLHYFLTYVKENKITDITAAAIEKYKQSLIEQKKTNATINNRLATLRKVYEIAKSENESIINPLEKVKSEKVKREFKKLPLNADEVKRLIEADHTTSNKKQLSAMEALTIERDRLIIKFLARTGLRLNGLTNILKEDISSENGRCRVKYLCKNHKTKDSYIFIDLTFYNEIKTFWSKAEAEGINSDHVFFTLGNKSKGNKISDSGLQLIVKNKAEAAGLTGVSPMTLRHSCAQLLAEQALVNDGHPSTSVMTVLNHKHVSTSELYYNIDKEIKIKRDEDPPELKLSKIF